MISRLDYMYLGRSQGLDMINSLILTPLGILARNLPESSKIHKCTFGNMPSSSKCTMHFRWSFIFSTYGLYFLPDSIFAPFEEVSTSFQQCWIFPNWVCDLRSWVKNITFLIEISYLFFKITAPWTKLGKTNTINRFTLKKCDNKIHLF